MGRISLNCVCGATLSGQVSRELAGKLEALWVIYHQSKGHLGLVVRHKAFDAEPKPAKQIANVQFYELP